ncbi:radical SAM protein [Candidatus Bathyarchaeota archaeon]|nr:MAG: radical SAM protein [Candidatus Bathyarchaeota archaeon]
MGKGELLSKLASLIGPEGVSNALSDPHSRRPPRPCGLTVHPGRGCPTACLYCYVGDVLGTGPSEPRPTPLSGLEMAYALAANPYFVPGRMGTFLAMGAICDPFHPSLIGRTLEIMRSVASHLGNPLQFSTKMPIDASLAREIPRRSPISPLVTLITLEKAEELEPNAPPPWERLEAMRELRKAGLKPMLFLRPIIPGLIERELEDLLSEAKSAGAVGVVVGSLRVSRRILARLARVGLDGPIRERLKAPPGEGLVAVPCPDLKGEALHLASEKGLLGFKSACCANAFCAQVPCADLCWLRGFCTNCPNRCLEKLPEVAEEDIIQALKVAFGMKALSAHVGEFKIEIALRRGARARKVLKVAKKVLEVATRRAIVFKWAG